MPTSYTETWDSDCTPPALPAAWNASAPYATVNGTTNGVTPTSGSQMLGFSTATNGYFLATYGAATDANSGDCVVSSKFNWADIGLHKARGGVCARGSSSTLDHSSTSYYTGFLDQQLAVVSINLVVNGAETLIVQQTVVGTLSTLVWYQVIFSLNGTALSLQLRRLSDGSWLNSSGNWQSGQATAIAGTDSSISTAGYAGIITGNDFGSQSLYTDDWSLSPFVPASSPRIGSRRLHAGEPRRRRILLHY